MELLLAFALFILLDYAALRWGIDSRDGFTESKPVSNTSIRRSGLL